MDSNSRQKKSIKVKAASNLRLNRDEINGCLDLWLHDDVMRNPEKALNTLYSKDNHMLGTSWDREFEKICMLNQVYNTNLLMDEIVFLANYIVQNASTINYLLSQGSPEAVNILTGAIKDQCGRYCYSFATKYCSFAATDAMKDQYPIYDSNVAAVYKVRWEIWNPENDRRFHKYDFDAWDENVVRNTSKYRNFKEAVYMMQKCLEKERPLTIKELDQYLWKAMDIQIRRFNMA